MNLKNFLKVLIAFVIMGVIVVGIAIYNDYKKEENTNKILENIKTEQTDLESKIQSIIDSTVDVKEEELPASLQDTDKPTNDTEISGIVSSAIDDSLTTEENFSNMEALSSDTFKCVYDGSETKFRLIGLKSDGSTDGLQKLLDNSTDLNIEYDTIKNNSDGYQLVYLWNGSTDNDENMINIQMIINKYASTTYLNTSDSIIETPNIKYSTAFIKYQKLINSQS